MSTDRVPPAWLRPGYPLATLLLVASLAFWGLGQLSPGLAWAAFEAEVGLERAYLEGDFARASEQGALRLSLPVAAPSPLLLGVLADAMGKAGRVTEALRVAERAVTLADGREGPGSRAGAAARNNLAWLLLTTSEFRESWEDALRLAREAVAVEPENPYYLGTLGTAEWRLGQLDGAREHLSASVARHTNPRARATDLVLLALVTAALGDEGEARRLYDRAVSDGRPDEPFWSQARERLGVREEAPPAAGEESPWEPLPAPGLRGEGA